MGSVVDHLGPEHCSSQELFDLGRERVCPSVFLSHFFGHLKTKLLPGGVDGKMEIINLGEGEWWILRRVQALLYLVSEELGLLDGSLLSQ